MGRDRGKAQGVPMGGGGGCEPRLCPPLPPPAALSPEEWMEERGGWRW